MRFEWDENKRLANIRKHGFDFADVSSIFDSDTLTLSALKRLRFLIQRVHLLRIPCKALNRGGSLLKR